MNFRKMHVSGSESYFGNFRRQTIPQALNAILVVSNFRIVVFRGHMLSSVEIKPDVYFVGALD